MKAKKMLVGLLLLIAPLAQAKQAPVYDKAVLLSMDAETCGTAEKGGKTVAGEILGTDSSHKQTQQVLCQEYVLQSDHIVYHIRPNDGKHPVLLPVGQMVEFRIKKDKLYVRDPEGDKKAREYTVTSIQMREGVKTASNLP
jgi:hypothetical protein